MANFIRRWTRLSHAWWIDLSVLPTLSLSDLNRSASVYPVDHKTIAEIPVQWRSTETNGLSYLRFQHTNYQNVPSALRFFLPLYTSVLTSIGVKGKSFETFEHELLRYTGGINSGFLYTNMPHGTRFTIRVDVTILTS